MNQLDARLADRTLARSLAARADQALPVHQFEHCPEGWEPVPAECHRNVDLWVAQHAGWRAVRGWVIEWVGMAGEVAYAAHSVAADPEGALWEVTKMDGRIRSFVPHAGSLDEFLANVKSRRWSMVSTM